MTRANPPLMYQVWEKTDTLVVGQGIIAMLPGH